MRARNYEFLFRTADARTRASLSGALFHLIDESGIVRAALSDEYGMVTFFPLPPGRYKLTEVKAPRGYVPVSVVYPISVDPCGHVCVNGQPSRGFLILNERSLD